MSPRELLTQIAVLIEQHGINFVDLFVFLFEYTTPNDTLDPLRTHISHPDNLNRIIGLLANNPATSDTVRRIALNITAYQMIQELSLVLDKSQGYHFGVNHMTAEKIMAFSRAEMANDLETKCPSLWHLLQLLLNTSATRAAAKSLDEEGDYLTSILLEAPNPARPNTDNPSDSDTDDGHSESNQNRNGSEDMEFEITLSHQTRGEKARKRQTGLSSVRCVSIMSILMQNSNVRCNQLQTLVGLFAHSTHTPEKVIDLLAHAGLSIAPSSINNMVKSMSQHALEHLKDPFLTEPDGEQEPVSFGFDNLDIKFPTDNPTIDYHGHLAHITTGILLPVRGAKIEDMRVSKEIWMKADNNPERDPLEPVMKITHKNLMALMKPASVPPEHPFSLQSRMAWHIRKFLLLECVDTLPSAVKDKLRSKLGLPEAKLSIPVAKMTQRPAQAMNVSVGNNAGNAVAIEKLLKQAGVNDSKLDEHVVLVHGDLGTGEKIRNLQNSRRIEKTPQRRLQYTVWVPGFFHIEMAMTDTIWRIYLRHQDPDSGKPMDPRSIFHLCGLTRPRETKKLATGPDHRMTHHTVYYTLVALIIEAWSLAVQGKYGVPLHEWHPKWEEVVEMSHEVVRTYVADLVFKPSHQSRSGASDMVNDASKLFARDTLLWVVTRHAARYGDVGCLEDVLPIWICIWKHAGKHKYAEHITRFLLNIQKTWPTKLAQIIRMNWLVNPRGIPGGFRGVDWVIERNNLMHKVIHAGGGSNRTLDNIIKESPLILVYQQVYDVVEASFNLTKSTLHHPPPSMRNTLAMLRDHVRKNEMYSHIHGRKLATPPLNAVAEGVLLGTKEPSTGAEGQTNPPFDGGDMVSEYDTESVLAGDEFDDLEW